MDVPVYNKKGEQISSLTIDEQSLGGDINHALLKQAFVRYHSNQRQGSARTKSRGLVEGSTRKLYRQKGTGRARMGTVRTPIRRGGGVTFAKNRTHEDFRKDMPVKMRRKANRNALLAKLVDNEVKVLDDLSFDAPKTRQIVDLMQALTIDRSCLLAVDPSNKNARLSARNVDGVDVCPSHELNVFNMLNHRYLVITKSCLESWLSGASSNTGKSARRSKTGEAA